jgi:hypothetical protein
MLFCNRSGEWGDHVTLQAAADRVSYLNSINLYFSENVNKFHFCFSPGITHLLSYYVAQLGDSEPLCIYIK